MEDASEFQRLADEAQPNDHAPAPLTRRQVQKAEAILSAYLEGQELWARALPDVAALLQAAHMDELIRGGHTRGIPTLTQAAAQLDTWPWPAPSRE